MLHSPLREFALYSLALKESSVPGQRLPAIAVEDPGCTSRKDVDMLVLTTKVGESILVPSHGLTIQVGAVQDGCVSLRVAVPSRTKVFRMGAFRRQRKTSERAR